MEGGAVAGTVWLVGPVDIGELERQVEGVRGCAYELIAELAMHGGLHAVQSRLESPFKLAESGLGSSGVGGEGLCTEVRAVRNVLRGQRIGLVTLS